MKNTLAKVSHNGEYIYIKKTEHLNDARSRTSFVRDQFIDDARYVDIIKHSIKHGLTSFRNKGPVTITFDDSWGLSYGLLCKLDDDVCVIITVFNSRKIPTWRFFVKVQNRINLSYYYNMKVMNKKEYMSKKTSSIVKKIDKECKSQDAMFLRAMNF